MRQRHACWVKKDQMRDESASQLPHELTYLGMTGLVKKGNAMLRRKNVSLLSFHTAMFVVTGCLGSATFWRRDAIG